MPVIVCPQCATRYRVNEAQLAKATKLRCKKCEKIFNVQDNIEGEAPAPARPAPAPKMRLKKKRPEPARDTEQAGLDLSHVQFSSKAEPEEPPEPPESQEDLSLDMNLKDMTLDFGTSPDTTSNTLDFPSSGPLLEESDEDTWDEEEVSDHISAPPVQSPDDSSSLDFSFQPGAPEDSSDDEGLDLDFSFSANVPESEEGDEYEEEEYEDDEYAEEDYEEGPEEAEEAPGDLSLGGLDFGGLDDSQTLTAPVGGAETLTDASGTLQEPSDESEEEYEPEGEEGEYYAEEEEDLPTCCIDSLAMGLTKCELCGRDLQGKDPTYARQLQEQRRQELKEGLLQGEVQISFSEEGAPGADLSVGEDFSDVEQALDALASGDFQEIIKKKEAKKNAAQRRRIILAIVMFVVLAGAGVFWFLLPSSHEKLLARYEEIMARPETEPADVATLFLEAVKEKDEDIFKRLSTLSTMPPITEGTVIGVEAPPEVNDLGNLGQQLQILQEETTQLEKEREEKTKALQQYASMDLSSSIIKSSMNSLEKKLAELQAEFDAEKAESAAKLQTLREEYELTLFKLDEARKKAQQYVDATDPQLKAVYVASVRNQKSLSEKAGRLEGEIREEEAKHQQRVQTLEAEYLPRFTELEDMLEDERRSYELALRLENEDASPVTQLTEEVEHLSQTIKENKSTLEETNTLLGSIISEYFRNTAHQQRLNQEKDNLQFIHINRHATASVKLGGTQQRISLVLGRYKAVLADDTLLSDWLVEDTLW